MYIQTGNTNILIYKKLKIMFTNMCVCMRTRVPQCVQAPEGGSSLLPYRFRELKPEHLTTQHLLSTGQVGGGLSI